MIVVLHAYSDVNLGDALLVELTVDRLRRLGVPQDEISIVALDPTSFAELGTIVGFGTAGRAARPALVPVAIRSLITAIGKGPLRALFEQADGFVAVGGGYLRSGNFVEQVGVAINHLPQLIGAAASPASAIYLPQSVGPLTGVSGKLLRRELAKIDHLWLRDDTSVAELGLTNASYCPDLAVLEVADKGPAVVSPTNDVLLIARELDSGRPNYQRLLMQLADHIDPDPIWAVQTEGATEKSDAVFYRSLGVSPAGSTAELLESVRPAVAVSVRLHGSIMSIAAGHPTVHLSYQRKGWSAMRDLGLSEYVHDAGDFDPLLVATQIGQIKADPDDYWARVTAACGDLRKASRKLDQSLTDAFDLPQNQTR